MPKFLLVSFVDPKIAIFRSKCTEIDFHFDYSGQPVTECVIVVPGFFGQAERTALLTAGNLANIKVLQLINDYSAVALNYGIFQRNEFNETAKYFVFYDMGAYKTTASVVSYQLVKDRATRETNPVIQVLGVGYDRTLGGLEMQLRLRDYLAKEFNKLKKTKTDVFTNPRALAKLFKEAGRVKQVLSANADHYAQIEGLLEEIDFKHQVKRQTFESLCEDLFDRVTKPLDDALKGSGLTLDVINQVTLFGGGTRVPKIQEVLKAHIGRELGKNINMDEAAAMGAVYKAADLTTGFKVKKFITKDAILFPIQVTFEREGNSGNAKLVRRSLFTAMSSYPQKKVITFNKNTNDFIFNVVYGELEHLPETEVKHIGNMNLLKIQLQNVAQTLEANSGENIESKGIKAHFVLDDSGLFSMSGVELVVEKTVTESDDESPLSKLGSTISKLFSSTDDEQKLETENNEAEANDTKETSEQPTEEADHTKNATADNSTAQENVGSAAVNKTIAEKPKLVVVKAPIENEVDILYTVNLKGDRFEESRKKVEELNELERQTLRRETALNALESFVIESQQKLNEDEYASCATAEEIEDVRKSCAEVSDWLYEDGENADANTYEDRLKVLQEKANEIYARHWEHNERPEALKALAKQIDGAKGFLNVAKNLTKETNPEKDIFTTVEVETLAKVINETQTWSLAEQAAQIKLKKYEPIRLTVKSITDRMALLDREVKYLMSKLKFWQPKVVPKKEKKAKNDTESAVDTEGAATNGTESTIEEPLAIDADATTTSEPADGGDVEIISPTKSSDGKKLENEDAHTEL